MRYVPLLMVYFAYGALGLIDVTAAPSGSANRWRLARRLAAIGVWLELPWTMKMVFGQFVNSIPILGSRRKGYVYYRRRAASAGGLVLLAGAAGKWITFASPEALYVMAMLAMTLGVVLQDVVADAMSTEVVERTDAAGAPRPAAEVNAELAMVQVLGRLALSFGLFATAGLGGWLASVLPYEQVFLLALAVPVISVTGVVLVRLETGESAPIDWRVLGGGIAFGAVVVTLGVLKVPYGQEIVFLISIAVICTLLVTVTADLSHDAGLQNPVRHDHHLRVPGHAHGRRRRPLVPDRRAEIRRGLLRPARPNLEHLRHRRHLAARGHDREKADHLDALLADDPLHDPLAAEPRPLLRHAPVDRARARLRRAYHRAHRHGGRGIRHSRSSA